MSAPTYDDAGNMNSHPLIASLTYDAENRQTTFSGSNKTGTYYYDGQGQRVQRVTTGMDGGTTIYVYDAFGKLAAEYSSATQSDAGKTFYRTTDHLGSTRVVSDQSGEVCEQRDYYPFGEQVPVSLGDSRHGVAGYGQTCGGLAQRFTAKERDDESGLDYFGARYFSAAVGRFLSADETLVDQYPEDPASWNLYKYVRNNPLRFSDPDGRTCVVNDDGSEETIDDGGETCEQVAADNATGDPEVEVTSDTVPLTDIPGQFFVGFGEFFLNNQPQGAVVAFNALAAGVGLQSIATATQATRLTTLGRVTPPNAIAGRITGYTSHGINQVLGRNGGRGVNAKAVLEAVRNPKKIVEQANGTVKYVGARATVILNQAGKVVTAWGKSRGPQQFVTGSGNAAQRAANARGFSFLPQAIR
jgi:RHS repeat-associated protein